MATASMKFTVYGGREYSGLSIWKNRNFSFAFIFPVRSVKNFLNYRAGIKYRSIAVNSYDREYLYQSIELNALLTRTSHRSLAIKDHR